MGLLVQRGRDAGFLLAERARPQVLGVFAEFETNLRRER
jgi:hypothetical protein